MIRNNKWKVLISSILILLPMFFGLLVWDKLPQSIATHWGFDGNADGWSSKAVAVLLMPTLLLGLHWLCLIVAGSDPKNKQQNHKAINLVFWIIPVLSVVVNGLMYANAFNIWFDMTSAMMLLFGVMFLAIGNYLPKCKQNYTIGVRVPWTLNDEENWNKTHRLSGRLWVISALVLLFSIWLPSMIRVIMFIAVISVICIVPIVYSYVLYKAKKTDGAQTLEGTQQQSELQKSTKRFAFAIAGIVVVVVAVLCFTGNIEMQYGTDAVIVEATYWKDLKIDYANINAIEYREQCETGLRINGFGSFALSVGEYSNTEFGSYTRYTYRDCDDCVVLKMNGKVVVLNGKDAQATHKIYDELLTHIEQE